MIRMILFKNVVGMEHSIVQIHNNVKRDSHYYAKIFTTFRRNIMNILDNIVNAIEHCYGS